MKEFFSKQKQLIDHEITRYVDQSTLYKHIEAARYCILPEGKRYRTIISLEIYRFLGGIEKKFLKATVGLEFLHHATLILDDLPSMDNSLLRKGKTAVHLKFGEANAILASIYLLEEGRKLLNESIREHTEDSAGIQQADLLVNQSIKELLVGQELDLRTSKNNDDLMRSILLKNKMFYLSILLPIYFLGRSDMVDNFERVGKNISIAYQLFDDLRDLQTVDITGKEKGMDREKNTSIYRYGVDSVKRMLEEKMLEVENILEPISNTGTLQNKIEFIFTNPS